MSTSRANLTRMICPRVSIHRRAILLSPLLATCAGQRAVVCQRQRVLPTPSLHRSRSSLAPLTITCVFGAALSDVCILTRMTIRMILIYPVTPFGERSDRLFLLTCSTNFELHLIQVHGRVEEPKLGQCSELAKLSSQLRGPQHINSIRIRIVDFDNKIVDEVSFVRDEPVIFRMHELSNDLTLENRRRHSRLPGAELRAVRHQLDARIFGSDRALHSLEQRLQRRKHRQKTEGRIALSITIELILRRLAQDHRVAGRRHCLNGKAALTEVVQ